MRVGLWIGAAFVAGGLVAGEPGKLVMDVLDPACSRPECVACLARPVSERLDCMGRWLKSAVESGAAQADTALCAAANTKVSGEVDDCHWLAHSIGEALSVSWSQPATAGHTNLTLSEVRSQSLASLSLCTAACINGCYHGVVSNYIRVLHGRVGGAAGLKSPSSGLSTYCSAAAGVPAYRTYSCVHGIGHGLLTHGLLTVPEAFETCLALPAQQAHVCRGGLTMQLWHEAIAKLRGSNKTFQAVASFGWQYPDLRSPAGLLISHVCDGAPLEWRSMCANAVGEGLMFDTRHTVTKALPLCAAFGTPQMRRMCVAGVNAEARGVNVEVRLPVGCQQCQLLKSDSLSFCRPADRLHFPVLRGERLSSMAEMDAKMASTFNSFKTGMETAGVPLSSQAGCEEAVSRALCQLAFSACDTSDTARRKEYEYCQHTHSGSRSQHTKVCSPEPAASNSTDRQQYVCGPTPWGASCMKIPLSCKPSVTQTGLTCTDQKTDMTSHCYRQVRNFKSPGKISLVVLGSSGQLGHSLYTEGDGRMVARVTTPSKHSNTTNNDRKHSSSSNAKTSHGATKANDAERSDGLHTKAPDDDTDDTVIESLTDVQIALVVVSSLTTILIGFGVAFVYYRKRSDSSSGDSRGRSVKFQRLDETEDAVDADAEFKATFGIGGDDDLELVDEHGIEADAGDRFADMVLDDSMLGGIELPATPLDGLTPIDDPVLFERDGDEDMETVFVRNEALTSSEREKLEEEFG